MEKYEGKAVFGGIAIGKIKVFQKEEIVVKRKHIEDVEFEKQRFEDAKSEAMKQLSELYLKAVKDVGKAGADIFEVHQMMLDDLDYLEYIYQLIENQNVNVEYAVAMAGDNFSSIFSMMDDEYMKARAVDVKDISERLIHILSNGKGMSKLEEPSIILAEDLTPSETVQMDKEKILAFVTVKGSANSHTAILARMMNIPALIGINIKIDDLLSGKKAIVNGNTGTFYIEPDDETLSENMKQQEIEAEKKRLLETLKGKESITKAGRKVKLYANIGSISDLGSVLKNDAEGIGLFRSEFLYLGRNSLPTEEEQFEVYKRVVETMAGKKVIIRTMDIGADKQADYLNLEEEENPALGYRAIRICLDRPSLFKVQLRAILRASVYGNIGIMYPMVISEEEVDQIIEIVEEVKKELLDADIHIGEVEQGIMIETPAAVMISDKLAKKMDFFSIGTNDLTQYTLAIDRQNPKLDKIYKPHHDAILRMIQMVVDNAHREGCWVGICGELGADTSLTEKFVEMGVDELSVAPALVLTVRDVIRNLI
ncbi:phosphoenolpyruvate--protein phosphotransferase [Anaerosacchariphilus polymeriproducens]|uniref:Phosphoenolpyruvate-protein phosphotransferase n=1 Tax=Anaerosacchariphilus polymeriproducens TaxID=1812858 RepID=A0A371AYQ0_9FIRM|nr:phosphoenolpyruvate--protein phosphotransferase [Anaerosacchariphilus polymeriproducens]RDU24687.1 phosphoenolpyruvate--protein phosphotransferase [Anaerosacchariphilus polymeriproducens]